MKVFVLFSESPLKFFGLWAEKKQGRQNSSLYVQKTFWGNQVEWETYSFDYRSRTYSGIHSDFSWKKKRECCHDYTLCPVDRFEENYVFRKHSFFSKQIRTLSKDFRFFVTNSRDGCQNCILRSIGTFHWRKLIFGEFHSLLSQFRILNGHFLDFWRKQTGMVAKIVFDKPEGSFWETKVLNKKKFLFFWTLSENWWHIGKDFLTAFSKMHTTCPGEVFPKFFLKFDELFCQFRS